MSSRAETSDFPSPGTTNYTYAEDGTPIRMPRELGMSCRPSFGGPVSADEYDYDEYDTYRVEYVESLEREVVKLRAMLDVLD